MLFIRLFERKIDTMFICLRAIMMSHIISERPWRNGHILRYLWDYSWFLQGLSIFRKVSPIVTTYSNPQETVAWLSHQTNVAEVLYSFVLSKKIFLLPKLKSLWSMNSVSFFASFRNNSFFYFYNTSKRLFS